MGAAPLFLSAIEPLRALFMQAVRSKLETMLKTGAHTEQFHKLLVIHEIRPQGRHAGAPMQTSGRWLFGLTCVFLAACTGDIAERDSVLATPVATATCMTPGCTSSLTCPPGQAACNGVCTNPANDPTNCGACGRSCGLGGACVANQCICAAGSVACGAACADTTRDAANCGACGHVCRSNEQCQQGQCLAKAGACNPACGGGSSCNAGKCVCSATLSLCAATCVDTQTVPEHCGACNMPCAAGQLCQAGKCQCPAGQMLCGKDCVDVQTSSANCGSCGKPCATGDACMASICGSPVGMDGCNGGPAHELNLRDIAVYQSIKIPVVQNGVAVARAQRVAAIVEGRPTLFRVFVDPSAAFTARDFSARIVVKTAGVSQQYFAKQHITKASSDADTASTFQVFVPAEKIAADTTYSIELVECAQGSGSTLTTRFPATGDVALETRKTGILKVVVLPVTTNARKPDTSDAALAVYRAYLEAMYPIEKAEIRVGTAITTAYPVNWTTLLEQIRTQRQTDKAAADEYFFGIMQPTATLKEYCRTGCTAGIGYVGPATQSATRAAVGLDYGDEMSAATMAHEVGHNHGRNHAPCAPGNNISGVDASYPYAGAKVGVWGYDSRKRVFFNPASTMDIMGYCDPKWISDYTYKGLVDRVASINGAKLEFADATLVAPYQVMIVDADGPRWSQPFVEPAEPYGAPEMADVLDIDGAVVEHITVYRTAIGDATASTVLVPEPKRGWNAIKLFDALPLPFTAPVTVPEPE